MRVELETQFNPGDVVWRKNLVTNEAYQVTITHVNVLFFAKKDKQGYCVMYFPTEMGQCAISPTR